MTSFLAGVLIVQVELFLLYFVILQKLEVGVVNVESCVKGPARAKFTVVLASLKT